MHRYACDGGPVKIAQTITEGEEGRGPPASCTCPATPRADRPLAGVRSLALSSDCSTRSTCGGASLPPPPARGHLQLRHRAGPGQHPQARRTGAGGRLAGPRQAGHGDVRGQLEQAADWTDGGPPLPPPAGTRRAEQRLRRRRGQRAHAARLAAAGSRRSTPMRSRASAGDRAPAARTTGSGRASCCSSSSPSAG